MPVAERACMFRGIALVELVVCPSCPVGQTARQQVWEQGFGANLAVALLPFVVIGFVSLWAERIGKAKP